MSSNEKLAIAAHLHVLMRRKTGRVTDTEWMASNPAYAAEIIRLAHLKAAEGGHDDLGQLADRLEAAMAFAGAPVHRPLAAGPAGVGCRQGVQRPRAGRPAGAAA